MRMVQWEPMRQAGNTLLQSKHKKRSPTGKPVSA